MENDALEDIALNFERIFLATLERIPFFTNHIERMTVQGQRTIMEITRPLAMTLSNGESHEVIWVRKERTKADGDMKDIETIIAEILGLIEGHEVADVEQIEKAAK